MPKTILSSYLYHQVLNDIKAYTPETFEKKVLGPSSHRILHNWLQANNFEMIFKAFDEENYDLTLYFVDKSQGLLHKILQAHDYKLLVICFFSEDHQFFDYLFACMNSDMREKFFHHKGFALFNYSLKRNSLIHLKKLLLSDVNGVSAYLSYCPDVYLLKIIEANHYEFFKLYMCQLESSERLKILKHQNLYLIKACIIHKRSDILRLILNKVPNLFDNVDPKVLSKLVCLIFSDSTFHIFELFKPFIKSKELAKTYTYFDKSFYDLLGERQSLRALEHLLIAAPHIQVFNQSYLQLKKIDSQRAKKIQKIYQPLYEAFNFIKSLMNFNPIVPEGMDELKNDYDAGDNNQKMILIQKILLLQRYEANTLACFEPVLLKLGHQLINKFNVDENHLIHPFFPVIVKYYYPIMVRHILSQPDISGGLMYSTLNFIQEVSCLTVDDFQRFPAYPNWSLTSAFVSGLIHRRNHVLYRELAYNDEYMRLWLLNTLADTQTKQFLKIYKQVFGLEFIYHSSLEAAQQKTIRFQLTPAEWIAVAISLDIPLDWRSFEHFKNFVAQEHLEISVKYQNNPQFS
jgi:hypothetical protein